MSFPFPKKEHKIYRNAFLQCVYIIMEYTQKPAAFFNDEYYQKLKKFITGSFIGVTYDEKEVRKNDAIQLKSDQDGVIIVLDNGRIILIVDRRKYRSFVDSVMPYIYKLMGFLKNVIKVETLLKVTEKKINFWQVAQNNNDQQAKASTTLDYDKLEKVVFSKNITDDFESKQQGGTPDKNGQLLKWRKRWKETEATVNISVSIIQKDAEPLKACLVLDSDYSVKDVSLKDLPNSLIEANDILFDAYHWSVSELVVKIMNHQNEERKWKQ